MDKEKVLFKNSTSVNEDELTAFQNFALKKTYITFSLAIIVVCGALGGGLCVLNLFLGIAIIACGLLAGAVLAPYVMKDQVKRQNKEMFLGRELVTEYSFNEDNFIVTTYMTGDENKVTETIEYASLDHVVDYQQSISLYLDKSSSLYLKKQGMTLKTAGELVEHLKAKGVKVEDRSHITQPTGKTVAMKDKKEEAKKENSKQEDSTKSEKEKK